MISSLFAVMEPRKKHYCPRSVLCCVFVLCTHLRLSLAGDCPADGRTWVPFKDKCYYFVHGKEDKIKSYTFERAKTLCKGFELLTIQSAQENDFVIKYSPEVWKGIVNVWLGMYYDTNSEDMRWFTDEPVNFTNWEDSSPSELVLLDTCAAMHSNTGKWEYVSCLEDVENGVILLLVLLRAQRAVVHPGHSQRGSYRGSLSSYLVPAPEAQSWLHNLHGIRVPPSVPSPGNGPVLPGGGSGD